MAETDKDKAPPAPAHPAPDPSFALMEKMVGTLDAIASRADRDEALRRPALPTPGLFEAGKGYHVIDSAGNRARHEAGRAVFLDEKLKPIPDEG